jgi:formamidopyrimidine-DNA glycosylase
MQYILSRRIGFMPELPEVQTVVNTLAPKVTGHRIVNVNIQRDDIMKPAGFDLAGALTGLSIKSVSRRAKRIVFELSDGNRFFVHLGMTGRLTIDTPGAAPAKHTHMILRFDGFEVRFRDPRRFGGVFWMGKEDSHGQICTRLTGPLKTHCWTSM